jgi:muramoyltetrapeptide carboxypeptidase
VKYGIDYTLQSFLEAVTNDAPYEVNPSPAWSDDKWYLDQEERTFIEQKNYLVINEGEAEGKLIGGNLSTLHLLQGTPYMPSLKDAILFIEEDEEAHIHSFDRVLQSLLQLPDANRIRGILIGRFQKDSNVTEAAIKRVIATKEELINIPVIANVNFGHVQPIATIPMGANATMSCKGSDTTIVINA